MVGMRGVIWLENQYPERQNVQREEHVLANRWKVDFSTMIEL